MEHAQSSQEMETLALPNQLLSELTFTTWEQNFEHTGLDSLDLEQSFCALFSQDSCSATVSQLPTKAAVTNYAFDTNSCEEVISDVRRYD